MQRVLCTVLALFVFTMSVFVMEARVVGGDDFVFFFFKQKTAYEI